MFVALFERGIDMDNETLVAFGKGFFSFHIVGGGSYGCFEIVVSEEAALGSTLGSAFVLLFGFLCLFSVFLSSTAFFCRLFGFSVGLLSSVTGSLVFFVFFLSSAAFFSRLFGFAVFFYLQQVFVLFFGFAGFAAAAFFFAVSLGSSALRLAFYCRPRLRRL